jgi:hypothetical protein
MRSTATTASQRSAWTARSCSRGVPGASSAAGSTPSVEGVGFDNREIASLIILVAIGGLLVANRHTRKAIRGVGKALGSKVALPFVGLALWVAALVIAGSQYGLWERALLSETVLWFVTPAVPLLVALAASRKALRDALIYAVGPAVFLEVFIGLSTFSLAIELLVAGTLTVALPLLVVAEGDAKYAQVRRFLETLVGLIGFALILHVLVSIASDWDGFDKTLALRALALPLWMTAGVLPYAFAVRLWADYDSAFTCVNHETNDRRARGRAKLALFCELGLRSAAGRSFRTYWARQLVEASTLRDTRDVVREHLRDRKQRAADTAEAEARLVRFAGVDGEDEDGRRLDQREFDETKDALHQLAGAQMGWYRNQGRRYRADLLAMLAPFKGLPEDHGISLSVSADGQSWWAWRRTVTGWCFAIGAAERPPDQWLHDGPEPPTGFPGLDTEWGERWGFEARNW